MTEEELSIDCERHGKKYAAVVCGHLLNEKINSLGFVENSSVHGDYQAWCNDCENLYLKEQERTDKFKAFCDFAIVCEDCYMEIKNIHDKNP